MNAVKAGWKTTEFWLGLVVPQILSWLTVGDVFAPDSVWAKVAALAVSALSAMGYSASRGKAKAPESAAK